GNVGRQRGLRRGLRVRRRAVVGAQRAGDRGGRPQYGVPGVDPAAGEARLAEGLLVPGVTRDVAVGAAGEVVVVGALLVAGRVRAVEEELVLDDRAADRAAELVRLGVLLLVLDVIGRGFRERVEHQALHRTGVERAAVEVPVALAAERVAAALGHRADDAAERAAVLGRDAGGLDLDFLQVLEHRVLARGAVDERVRYDAVDGERVLGAAGAVHLNAALDLALADRRGAEGNRLERTALRQAVELFRRDVVADDR